MEFVCCDNRVKEKRPIIDLTLIMFFDKKSQNICSSAHLSDRRTKEKRMIITGSSLSPFCVLIFKAALMFYVNKSHNQDAAKSGRARSISEIGIAHFFPPYN